MVFTISVAGTIILTLVGFCRPGKYKRVKRMKKRNQDMPRRGHKRWLQRLFSPGVIFLLLIGALLFHVVGRLFIQKGFEQIYTPPALTQEKVIVYSRFVKFIETHPEYSRVHLSMWGYERLIRRDSLTRETVSSRTTDDELIEISKGFKKVSCMRAEKNKSYVVFISKRNYIMPTRPGVLYSLDGSNPNSIEDEFFNSNKPFIPIKEKWYMSRSLVTSLFRKIDAKIPLSESYIDHSLRDPNPVATKVKNMDSSAVEKAANE